MSSYTDGTILRCATIVRNADENAKRLFIDALECQPVKTAAPKNTRKARAVKAATAWQNAPASAKQIERIRGKEARLNLPLTPENGAGMTGIEAREWNTALNVKLGYTGR
jgi:hypothetical protein